MNNRYYLKDENITHLANSTTKEVEASKELLSGVLHVMRCKLKLAGTDKGIYLRECEIPSGRIYNGARGSILYRVRFSWSNSSIIQGSRKGLTSSYHH